MKLIKLAAAGLAVALTAIVVPTTVHAGETPMVVEGITDRPVKLVSYADLNLANAEGVAQLNRRVRRAAAGLCIDNGVQPLKSAMLGRECYQAAIADAGRQIDLAIANFGKEQFAASQSSITVALK